MVADIEELEEMDASELHARRLNAKEVLTPMKGEKFIFSVADGTVKTPGGDRRLKPSALIRDRPAPNPLQDDSTRDDAEAENDFWSISGDFIYRHHVEPRVKMYVPTEESFPTPPKYTDATRTTDTTPDVMSEKHIEDYWNVDGERELSEASTGLTRFILLNERHRLMDFHGPWETDEGNKRPQDPTMCGQICGSICPMQRKSKVKQRWTIEKPKFDNARR